MSSPPVPNGRSERTMSSRLLTMKFMQRAAAASSHSNDQKPDGAPSKRRKLSDHQPPPITPSADAQFLQAAADAEDVKRAAAMERLATEAGETRWVLSTADAAHTIGTDMKLRILTTGYSDIDQDVQSMGWQGSLGRRSFGLFNRAIEKQQIGATSSASSSRSESEDEHGDAYSENKATNDCTDSTKALLHQPHHQRTLDRTTRERMATNKAEKADATYLAEDRRNKEVDFNRSTSILGGGAACTGMECHFCGQKAHKKAGCPRKARLKRRGENM